MNKQVENNLEVLSLVRKKFLAMTEALSLEQLNLIPSGYNNNLIWNIIHSPVSTDLLTYGPCGLPIPLAKWVDDYRKATKPDPQAPVSADMLEEVKRELSASYDRWVEDYQAGVFKDYKPYQTEFGVVLTGIEYAIIYAIDHEMLHLGYAMALRRRVIQ